MYKNRLLARKVYDAAILLTVLGQEGGLVPSEGFPKPPFSPLEGGLRGPKWTKMAKKTTSPKKSKNHRLF